MTTGTIGGDLHLWAATHRIIVGLRVSQF